MVCNITNMATVITSLLAILSIFLTENRSEAQHDPATTPFSHKRLIMPAHCPGQVISSDSGYQTSSSRSVLECLSLCAQDVKCLSVTFNTSSRLCYHNNDTARLDCSNMVDRERGVKYYETEVICEKEEEQPGPGGTCVCAPGYRGNPCASYISDCHEGYAKGTFTTNGVFSVHPLLAEHPFDVRCKQMSRSRTYIMERRSNTLNFNRTFSEYQTGFGDLTGDHFIGLDKMYQLTSSKTHELRITAKLFNGTSFFMQYQQFNISGPADGYRMRFNRSFADDYRLGDCFSPLFEAQFSARDHDRDEDDTVNCALKHGGGWWFRGENCSSCNPTGPLLMPSDGWRTGVDAEAFWADNMGDAALYKIGIFLVDLSSG